jgi:hypothetical protein
MTQTTSTSVSSHILSEALSPQALAPLREKFVVLPHLNMASIAGQATKVRKIPKRTAASRALDDTEGVVATADEALGYTSAISSTPSTKVKTFIVTGDAIELAMPGATKASVMAAVQGNNPAVLPLVAQVMQEIVYSHYLRAEYEALQLFSGFSESAGTGNPALSFGQLLEALYKLLDNNPEHEDLGIFVEEVGVADLRSLLVGGTGAALSAVWGNSAADVSIFQQRPDASRNGFRGSFMGMPIFACSKNQMATANGAADRVGALMCLGSGATAAPGSKRGAIELTERYEPALGFSYDLESDTLKAIGRWCWNVVEHTDEHGVKLIYDID